ncbi:hypothetical protein ACH9L7_17655 (plasmid) [Haloferax sp. S1W]|uniref:hypothetical protein n=1 Tax=Haloferax sp. S1W TaxID=3377110 RepID=UPI0037C641E2
MAVGATFSTTVVGTSESAGSGVFDFETSVLIRRSKHLHVWVFDDHFVDDPEGCVQKGQYVLVTTSVTGVVALVTDTAATDAPDPNRRVKVEARCWWDDDGVETDPTTDYWSKAALEGREDWSPEGDATVEFIRPTKR